MKLIKQANGKTTVKMSQSEWETMGKKAGWMKEAASPWDYDVIQLFKKMIPNIIDDPDYPMQSTAELAQRMLNGFLPEQVWSLAKKYGYDIPPRMDHEAR